MVSKLLLVAFLTLAIAEGSVASTFTGERPAGPMVQQLVGIGYKFWTDRNVHPCAQEVYVAPTLWLPGDTVDRYGRPVDTIYGRAIQGGCTIWIARWAVRNLSGRPDLCRAVVHEMGHTAGLTHTDGNVMSSGAYPWECRVWARGLRRR